MNIIYADCFSGISGDMLLGALIELGIDMEWLQSELSCVGIESFRFETNKVKKGGIQCTQCKIICHGHEKVTRGIEDIKKIIKESNLKQNIKDNAIEIFQSLADAEAKIHNIPVSEIHFHELGALDSLVDILGVIIAFDNLGIKAFYSSPLPLGRGLINTQHGPIPVPAPATLALLSGIPVIHTGIEAELVTPTGAALVNALARGFGAPPEMVIKKIGYGAGTRDLPDRPNCLRLILGESEYISADTLIEEYIEVLNCDIDDMNPEFYTYIMENLFNAGALDVTLSQIIMKKGRPGVRISVLAQMNSISKLVNILLTETTTTGIRVNRVRRYKASRQIKTVLTQYGPVRVKYAWKDNNMINVSPEYEDCFKIARKYNRPLKFIYQEIIAEVLKKL